MTFWQALLQEGIDNSTAVLLAGLLVTSIVARTSSSIPQRRLYGIAAFCVLHVVLLPLVAYMRIEGSDNYRDVRLVCLVFAGLAGVSMGGIVLFGAALPRMRVELPKIVQDLGVGIASVLVLFAIAARAGYNLSGLVTTSAVLTAVVGLALQETLGSIAGGLALQADDSIQVGDWIVVGDGDEEGKVTEIRWRYTALENRNWETVVIPNTQLVKERVRILNRRGGIEGSAHRRWIRFNVDFRWLPSQVIRVVEDALRDSPIRDVSELPPPDCIIEEVAESYSRYAVRYFTHNPLRAPIVDSDVLTRIMFALKRADIPTSMPAQAVFLTHDTLERRTSKERTEHDRRVAVLRNVELLKTLAPEELDQLANELESLRFGDGEYLTREGDIDQSLFILTAGELSVRVRTPMGINEVARVKPGEFVGEGAALTGEARAASAVAAGDVECYRLTRDAFERIVRARPAIADDLAHVLSLRQAELQSAMENAQAELEAKERMSDADFLDRVRGFFGLVGGSTRPPSNKN